MKSLERRQSDNLSRVISLIRHATLLGFDKENCKHHSTKKHLAMSYFILLQRQGITN